MSWFFVLYTINFHLEEYAFITLYCQVEYTINLTSKVSCRKIAHACREDTSANTRYSTSKNFYY